MIRVLVTGGRHYKDKKKVFEVLDQIHELSGISAVGNGHAAGADSLAHLWCRSRGVKECRYRANWLRYGKRAGPIRNAGMLSLFQPDLIVAFPGGEGTANMVSLGNDKGVPVVEVEE